MKKQIIIAVIITSLICITGTSYATYKLTASQVSFDKSNTNLNSNDVQGAIDELADITKKINKIGDPVILFENGQFNIITGFTKTGGSYSVSDQISFSRSGNSAVSIISDKIDLTNYSILNIEMSVGKPYSETSGVIDISIRKLEDNNIYLIGSPESKTASGTWTLDVSDIIGEAYIAVGIYGNANSCTISKIWLR